MNIATTTKGRKKYVKEKYINKAQPQLKENQKIEEKKISKRNEINK
ncbi:hypothetical protein [Avibacterium sp. 21-599]|nr:hypothetical protein [Avibacterium sp. 21-599]MCW9718092.1 hypothetical protein [Avibacterium sp. 21-599]